jgi:hypothetical protein
MMIEAMIDGGVNATFTLQAARVGVRSYQAELSSDLLDPQGHILDAMIGFAFDTLDACHLDLRVVSSERFEAEHGTRAAQASREAWAHTVAAS